MMYVDIMDLQVFASIDPSKVENYLRANHWQEQQRLPNDLAIWYKFGKNGKIYRLWLPLDYQLADFTTAMKRAINVISQAEDRSQLQIFEDLNTIALGDIIRLNSQDVFNHHSSSLPIDDGLTLIEQGKRMLAAGAMSVVKTREVHPPRRARVVVNYLDRLRLGQTEHGSYTVKVISPLREIFRDKVDELPDMPPKLPFERRAVMKLVQGLNALHDVSDDLHKRGRFHMQPFIETVGQGVSANLCDAVYSETGEGYRPLEVSVTWSYALEPSQTTAPTTITFPTEHMDYIAQAAKTFRDRNPEKRTVRGYVRDLRREQGSEVGSISLVATIDQRMRVVHMELTEEDYQQAIHAHENEVFAVVAGRLVKRGRSLWLENPHDFHVIEIPPLPL